MPEGDVAVYQSKQGVVFAHAHVVASVKACAALAHDDGASADEFAAKCLDAEHLRVRVATVARGAAAFFFCYGVLLLANYLPALMVEISTSV